MNNSVFMSLVAHRFRRVEFRTLVLIFQLREESNNKYLKFDTSKSMSYQGQGFQIPNSNVQFSFI